MKEMLRDIERGWRKAGIARLARPERIREVASILGEGDRDAVAGLPALVGLSPAAVVQMLTQGAYKAGIVRDLIESQMVLLSQMNIVGEAVSDAIIEVRASVPVQVKKDGMRSASAWIANAFARALVDWAESGVIKFEPVKRRAGLAVLDLERIGTLVNDQNIRGSLVVAWVGSLALSHQALRNGRTVRHQRTEG
jgi:hypothetical protein